MGYFLKMQSDLLEYLAASGFKRRRNVFLRLHGEGILQSIYTVSNPSEKNGNIAVAVRSIYEPEVFGAIKVYQGALTYPYDLDGFCRNEELSRKEILLTKCMPILNNMNTQQSFYKIVEQLEEDRFLSTRWYMNMLMIPAHIYCNEFDVAIMKCNEVYNQNPSIHWVNMVRQMLQNDEQENLQLFLENNRKNNLDVIAELKFK